MHLETGRLVLWPMTPELLAVSVKNQEAAVAELGLDIAPRDFPERQMRRKIHRAKLFNCRTHPDFWLLCTSWLIVLPDQRLVIGEAGFKGCPENGGVEIGYGIHRDFRGWKYAQEAVGALCTHVFQYDGVEVVRAETLRDNLASQSVLRRCGFTRVGTRGKFYDWLLPKAEAVRARDSCIAAGQYKS